ncbi:hypothetical protein OKW21_002745 [Catalinimonas alkaloidigena]|uniref:hypothetical protein n=1 Tax=Catalinimonas alkaloidigena TaxID=1075417 RepID=UPI0024060FA6|nr:hypothetical protein [Catalinimonas alkaloidigena]MDF9797482.1 hypothetical protein [Catalinimonas alkaloidigena]
MLHEIILIAIFLGALYYLGRLVYKSFASDKACPKGCGSCDAVDFKKIQEQIKIKEAENQKVNA